MESDQNYCFSIAEKNQQRVRSILEKYFGLDQGYVAVAPGAANRDKRWGEESFARVCDEIINKYKFRVVFIGDWEDKKISCRIIEMMQNRPLNLCGETTLVELGEIIRHARFVLVNDSAPMHLASYLDIPVLALFGPSDPANYGPWSPKHILIHKNSGCSKCLDGKSAHLHSCMKNITTDEVIQAVDKLIQMIK